MVDSLVLTVAAGAAMAGFVQGLSGFGYGLTAMSIWAWTLEPRLAAALAVFGGLTGQLIAAATIRRGFETALVLPFIAGGLAGLPMGLWLLPRLDGVLFKFSLGLLLVVFCPLMLMASRLPRVQRGARLGDVASGLAGGIMGGLGGFTGVAPTLWCQMRGLDKDRQRAVIQNFNLAMLAVTFASYLATGVVERSMLPLLAVAAPAMLVPTLLGGRLYLGISETAFRRVVLGLLTASGVALLAASIPSIMARSQNESMFQIR